VGKLDYRASISDPYPYAISGNPVTLTVNQATFAGVGHHKQYQGHLMYMFFDKEDHTTPGYFTGSYLGKKKILSVGGGFIYQRNATWYHQDSTDSKGNPAATGAKALGSPTATGAPAPNSSTVYNDMVELGLEVFYDSPLNKDKGTAMTLMGGFYHIDYGKNYIRMNGLMNPALVATSNVVGNGTNSNGTYNGSGNAYPMFGSGNTFYMQAAYLFKRDMFGEGKGTLQPYVCGRFTNYQYLKDPMQVFNAGVNWLIDGHKSKISLDWELRPIYNSKDHTITQRASQVVLQYQIFI
jgi:hypothetical protein